MSSTLVKTVARRDSATTILRKLGIQPRDYNLFIVATADNQFAVKVGAAEKHLKDLAGPSTKEVKAKAKQEAKVESLRQELVTKVATDKASKASKTAFREKLIIKNPVTEKPTLDEGCGSYCKRLIKAGHSNQEIWPALVEHYQLDDGKKGYPAWYRWQLAKVDATQAV